MDVVVTGADELYAVAKRLRGADKTIRKEMLQAIRTSAKPMLAAARASAAAELPTRGGLNTAVARSRFSVQTKTAARTAGVRLKATNPHEIGAMNRGRLRHPVFGNRRVWATQSITPGWWTKPLEAHAPAVRTAVAAAVARAAVQIEKG